MLKYIKNGLTKYEPFVGQKRPTSSVLLPKVSPADIDRRFYHTSLAEEHGSEVDGHWILNPVESMSRIDVGVAGCVLGDMYDVNTYLVDMLSDIKCHSYDGELHIPVDRLLNKMVLTFRAETVKACDVYTASTISPGDSNEHWIGLYTLCKAYCDCISSDHVTKLLEFEIAGTNYTLDGFSEWIVNKYEEYSLKLARLRSAGKRARLSLDGTSFDTLNESYINAATLLTSELELIIGE